MTSRPIIGYAIPINPTPAALDHERERCRRRPERHNASIDEVLADGGACAQIHLPTGRVCHREHHHIGSCQFKPPSRPTSPTPGDRLEPDERRNWDLAADQQSA